MSKSKKAPAGAQAAGKFDVNMFGNFEEMMKQSGINMDDPSLEAELNELMGADDDDELSSPARPVSSRGIPPQNQPTTSRNTLVTSAPREAGRAPSQASAAKAVPDIMLPDISNLVDDPDMDVDENDPSLLAELSVLEGGSPAKQAGSRSVSPVPLATATQKQPAPAGGDSDTGTILNERIAAYKEAINDARARNETSKQSRYERQLTTLNSLLKQYERGKPVDPAAIPPAVFVRSAVVQTPTAEAPRPVSQVSNSLSEPALAAVAAAKDAPTVVPKPVSGQKLALSFINQPVAPAEQRNKSLLSVESLATRRESYKQAALNARGSGDLESAKQYVSACKQLDAAITAVQNGEAVAASSLPPPDPTNYSMPSPTQTASRGPQPSSSAVSANVPDETDALIQNANALVQAAAAAAAANASAGSAEPQTLLEALELRLARHTATRDRALQEGNETRASRLSRICTQYNDAVRLCKKTGTVPVSTLTALPNFPDLPDLTTYLNKPAQSAISASASAPSIAAAAAAAPVAAPAPAPVPAAVAASVKTSQMRMIELLQRKRDELKASAISAKQRGQMDLAKDYLRAIHKIQPLIDASEAGLPVDSRAVREALSGLPTGANAGSSSSRLSSASAGGVDSAQWEVVDPSTMSRDEAYSTLTTDLQRQISVCQHHIRYFEQLGRVADANKFKTYLTTCEQDLRTLQNALQHGDPVPKFHYEARVFTITKCCPDLTDSDFAIEIVRGVNYRMPDGYSAKDFQTYVVAELQLSSEQTHSFRVPHAAGGAEHIYNHAERIQINRRSAAFQRIIKTKQMKCEVYAKKKSLFGKDLLLGTAFVRLNGLENECDFHTSFDLLDEKKKPSGGMLEVRLRLRSPMVEQKAVDQRERWLVIDQFLRTAPAPAARTAPAPAARTAPAPAARATAPAPAARGVQPAGPMAPPGARMGNANTKQQMPMPSGRTALPADGAPQNKSKTCTTL